VEGLAVVAAGKTTCVLLTGAAGFLGAHLTRLLLAEGHHVVAVVKPGAPTFWRIADVAAQLTIIEGDLGDVGDNVARIRAQKPEICVHLAWRGWSGKPAADANLSSLGVSLELLRKMPALACRRFVAAGTCFEYDLDNPVLTEQTPLKPHDLYGSCKKSLFEVAQEFSALTGISVATPRIFYSYGPYEDPRRLVPSIALALMNDHPARATRGEQVRDYLHAADIASAIWAVAQSDLTGAVNVASGVPVTIAQIARRIGELLGKPDLIELGALNYREGEPMHIVGSRSRLRELGWAPRFDLDRGLSETLQWWREAPAVARHA
jgi:nucleoside-diphosphate-sugar epimerase